MSNLTHDSLGGITENNHHNRSHNHNDSGDNYNLAPRSITLHKESGGVGAEGLVIFERQDSTQHSLIYQKTTSELRIQGVGATTTIRIGLPSGTDDHFRFQAYDGGANNKGRIQWTHNGGSSYFYTKEYYDTIYPAKSDYDTHVANNDAHHNEDHTHSGDSIDPSLLWGIGGASGIIGTVAAPLSTLLFESGQQLSKPSSGKLVLEGMDFEIYDGKAFRLWNTTESVKLDLTNDGTNIIYNNNKASGGSHLFRTNTTNRFRVNDAGIQVFDGLTGSFYSSGNDKLVTLNHNDTDAIFDVPSGSGHLKISVSTNGKEVKIQAGGSDVFVVGYDTGSSIPYVINKATWTTATRPGSPVNGTQGYNSTTGLYEIYRNGAWSGV